MSERRYKLTYFNVRAIGEPVRYLFAYMGKDFEDIRIGGDWPLLKKKMPFGKLPILEMEGEVFHQSAAICRFLAAEAGLAGTTPLENLRIDQAVGAFNDLTAEIGRMYNNPEDTKLKQVMLSDTLPFYLSRFDSLIAKNSGFLANSKLSWADLYVAAYSESLPVIFAPVDPTANYPNFCRHRSSVSQLPGISDWIRNRPPSLL